MLRFAFFVSACLLPACAAAQQFTDVAQQLDGPTRIRMAVGTPTRVQVTYQLQVPLPAGTDPRALSIDEQKKSIGDAHSAIYELAARECAGIQVSLRGECRLVSVTIGGGYGGQVCNGCSAIPVNGSASFEMIQPSPGAPNPKP